jgi:hypothetical protein
MRLQNDRAWESETFRTITLDTLGDLARLSESVDVECKLATGADGKGQPRGIFGPVIVPLPTHTAA